MWLPLLTMLLSSFLHSFAIVVYFSADVCVWVHNFNYIRKRLDIFATLLP
jgi:hypothetical protein